MYVCTTAALSIHLLMDNPCCNFHDLAIINSAGVNIGVHVSFSILVSSGYMPNSGISGSYGSFIPRFFFFFSGYMPNSGISGSYGSFIPRFYFLFIYFF